MLTHLHPLIELAAWAAFALGGLLCLMNFSLPMRYYYRRWKKLPEERHVSPIPLLGSLIVFLVLRALDVIPVAKAIGWILIAVDVGGIHWMAFAMIYYAVRSVIRRPREPAGDASSPQINPVVVVVIVLLALAWLVKAFA